MSVYSTNIFTGTLPTSYTTLYTVPANTVLVVRDICIYNSGAGSSEVLVGCTVSGSNAQLFFADALASLAYDHLELRGVIPAGDILQGAGLAGGVQAVISGYLLS